VTELRSEHPAMGGRGTAVPEVGGESPAANDKPA